MTKTEIIATKLFGWERMNCEWPDEIWYCHPSGAEHRLGTPYNEYIVVDGEEEWPDFEDVRLQWYWIRRMEDALLAKRWLLERYMMTLDGEFTVKAPDPMPGTCITWQSFAMLRATAEQRVEAAVKVLEGIEREKAKKAEQLERAERRRQIVRAKAAELKKTMRCNCDLDNWVPEDISGHSHVCRIHKEAVKVLKEQA